MIDALNRQHGLNEVLHFDEGRGGLPRMRIDHAVGQAEVYLQGAHLTHWQPANEQPVLFMSERSFFEAGKPIRGGVPVIFPWFGPHKEHDDAPLHGVARVREWHVLHTAQQEDEVAVTLALDVQAGEHAIWPHACQLQLTLVFASALSMTLQVLNRDAQAIHFEQGLHTYFAVGDVTRVQVGGLENSEYVDKVAQMQRSRSGGGPMRIAAETDRVHPHTASTCTIDDPSLGRRLVIEKMGSQSTVLWNPWIDKAAKMPDFGDEEWKRMLCIETLNVMENAVTLPPGATHALTARVTVERLA